MREFLVPIFGQWGAVVAQFLITVVIVFGLIGLVWWFVRRYSGVHFGGIGRGRVPRLAVVDMLAVDRRRKLVLVRRDNVEHLLLIGGPSDVVVEGAIQRVRQRTAQQAAQAAAARAALQPGSEPPPAQLEAPQPEAASGERRPLNAPIPFPLVRSVRQQVAAGNGRAPLRPERQAPPAPPPETAAAPEPAAEAPAASPVEPQRPIGVEAYGPDAEMPQRPRQPAPQEPAAEALLSEVMVAEAEPLPPSPAAPAAEPAPRTFAEAELEAAEAARQSALDLGDGEAPATAAEPPEPAFDAPEQPEVAPANSTNRVSDLEREMARLLDEITTRRSS